MLAMSLEAVQQLCAPNRHVEGFYIQTARFIKSLILKRSPDDRTEVILQLNPIRRPYEKDLVWFEATIFALSGDVWSECYRATVQVQYATPATPLPIDGGNEKRLIAERLLDDYRQQSSHSCTKAINPEMFYSYCTDHGWQYGKRFQLLNDIRWDGSYSVLGTVDVTGPDFDTSQALFHPAVLDSAFQLVIALVSQGASENSPTIVPVHISDMWITASRFGMPHTSQVRYSARASVGTDRLRVQSTIYAIGDDNSPLCTIGSIVFNSVSNNDLEPTPHRKLFYGIDWKPQLSLLNPQQLRKACNAELLHDGEGDIGQRYFKLNLMINEVLATTYNRIEDRRQVPKPLRKYLSWMEHYIKDGSEGDTESKHVPTDNDFHIQEIANLHTPWKFFTVAALNLKDILCGEKDPLDVLFGDESLTPALYSDFFDIMSDHRFQRLLDLLSHENPNIKIMEVGAGTGGWTKHVLSTFHKIEERTGGSAFSSYHYTDLSLAFIRKASELFSDSRMIFKSFDLELDCSEQGFERETFDLVIAGSVLHATRDLGATIRNIHQLLKPGGHMIILEPVVPDSALMHFGFGLLPGWWSSKEEWRAMSPIIDEPRWNTLLKDNGFSGNDLVLRDFESDVSHAFSIIFSTAAHQRQESPFTRIYFVVNPQSEEQTGLARTLLDRHIIENSSPSIVALDQVGSVDFQKTDVVVALLELDTPRLSQIEHSEFELLKLLTRRVNKLLWIASSSPNGSEYPYSHLMQGFLRSMRAESFEKHIVTLHIETHPEGIRSWADIIRDVCRASFIQGSTELDYVARRGQVLSGRAFEEASYNEDIRSLIYPQLKSERLGIGRPVKLSFGSPGILDSLRFVEDISAHKDELGSHEIEIQAKAWSINFRDIFVALGRLEGTSLGVDCTGIVTRVGSACSTAIQTGDRVCMLSPGCMRTYPRAHELCVVAIPDKLPDESVLSFEAAASITTPAVTAYQSLVNMARLREGEKVLIHSASGSTGQVAIWIAKMIGAEIFVTVGYEEKKEFLMSKFGIPPENIFYSRNTTFAQGILRVTNGYGVDVVLNSLSGDGLRASLECLAPYGRFVEIGKADIVANSGLPMSTLARNVSLFAVDLYHIIESNPTLTNELLKATMDLLVQGTIRHPSPIHIYPVSDIENAFRLLQGGKSVGRIVIAVDQLIPVPVSASLYQPRRVTKIDSQKYIVERRDWSFDPNASYIIVGGLGGIGRAIVRWMVGKGAKHFILPSRSGPSNQISAAMLSRLEANDIRILAPKCDTSSMDLLSALLEECANKMPPIKGCINAAMVLQVMSAWPSPS